MAITRLSMTQSFSPSYNEVKWYFDSTNKNESGFNYIVSVYDNTNTLIYYSKYIPRYSDGYLDLDLSEILSNRLSYTNPIPTVSVTTATYSYFEYNLIIGEEYSVDWRYDDYEFYSNTASIYNGYTKLASTASHNFSVGDQIEIIQDDPTIRPILNGLHTVVEVASVDDVIIELPFWQVGSGPTVPGTVSFADGRKTIFNGMATFSNCVAWNGSFDPYSFLDYNWNDYDLTNITGDKYLLTDLPLRKENKYIEYKDTNHLWVNLYNNYSTIARYIYFEDESNNIFRQICSVGTYSAVTQNPVGPANANPTLVSGTGSFITSSTRYYDFWVTSSTASQISEKYRIYINRDCDVNDMELLYLDTKGGWLPMPVTLRKRESSTNEMKTYRKIYGDLSGDRFTYNTYDSGLTIYNSLRKNKIVVNTPYLLEDMVELVGIMKNSPAYMLRDADGVWKSVILTNRDFEFKTRKNNKGDIQYELELEYSLDVKINI